MLVHHCASLICRARLHLVVRATTVNALHYTAVWCSHGPGWMLGLIRQPLTANHFTNQERVPYGSCLGQLFNLLVCARHNAGILCWHGLHLLKGVLPLLVLLFECTAVCLDKEE